MDSKPIKSIDQTNDLRGVRRLLEQFCHQSSYLMQSYLFTGIKETMLKMLLSYNSLWLRIGLEVNLLVLNCCISCAFYVVHMNSWQYQINIF